MKYLQSALAATILLTSANASALEGQYLGAQLGFSNLAFFDTGLAVIATYGAPIRSVLPDLQIPDDVKNNLSLEAEFTTNLLSPPSFIGNDVTAHTFGGYGVFSLPVTPELSLRGRAGLLLAIYSDSGIYNYGSGINLTFGGGVTYQLSDNMNFIAEYTRLDSGLSNVSGGVQLRF